LYLGPQAVVKERYRAISSALAAMEAEQSGWTIPDGVLRANLRDALAEVTSLKTVPLEGQHADVMFRTCIAIC
jgi:hypothetical protein